MLEVSKSSWHYRLWSWGKDGKQATPINLCRYFWFIVLIIVTPIVLVSLALFGVGFIIWLIYSNPVTSAIVVGCLILAAALIVGVSYFAVKHEEKKERERDEQFQALMRGEEIPKEEKQPSIFRTWLAAKKQKVCPLIKVVD